MLFAKRHAYNKSPDLGTKPVSSEFESIKVEIAKITQMIGDYNKAFNKPQNLPPQPAKPGLKLNQQMQTLEKLQQQLDVIRNEIVGKIKPPKM